MLVADTVNEWFRQRLAGGALAQHTPAYNQVVEALPALISALQGGPVGEPAPAEAAVEPVQDDADHHDA